MAIQIGGTGVISDARKIQFISGLRSGLGSTISYNSVGVMTGTFNISDQSNFASGDPNLAAPTNFSGAIVIDGILNCGDFTTTLGNEV